MRPKFPLIKILLLAGALVAPLAGSAQPSPAAVAAAPPAADPASQATSLLANEALTWEERRKRLQDLANSNPRNAPVWAAYGEALKAVGEEDASLMAFDRAIEADQNLFTPHYQRGLLLKRPGPNRDLAAAEQAFRRALAAGSPRPQTLNELAVTLAMGGKLKDAADAWRRAAEADPDWGVVHSNLIKALTMLGDEEEAMAQLPAALAAGRFEESAVLILGEHLLREGDEDEAAEVYRAATARYPGNANFWYYLGAALAADGKEQDAREALLRGREAAKEDYRNAQAIEFALFRLEHPKDEARFQEARELVYQREADGAAMQRNLRRALGILGPLIEEHPDFWNGWFIRAVAKRRLGDLAGARADLEQVLQILPDEPNATMELALLERDDLRLDRAAELAQKAADLAPRDPLFATNAGLVMIDAGNCEAAWGLYRRAVALVGEENTQILRDQLDIRCGK